MSLLAVLLIPWTCQGLWGPVVSNVALLWGGMTPVVVCVKRRNHGSEEEEMEEGPPEGERIPKTSVPRRALQSDLCFIYLVIWLVVNCEDHPWFWLSLLLRWF